MKTCYENNGATIDVGSAATVHNPLFLMFTLHMQHLVS